MIWLWESNEQINIVFILLVKKGECNYDTECSDNKACISNQCIDPCIHENPCGRNAICKTSNHRPFCQCPPGLAGDPHAYCYECRLKEFG